MKIKQVILDEKYKILSPEQVVDMIPDYATTINVPVILIEKNSIGYVKFLIYEVDYEKRPFCDLFVTIRCKRCYPQTEAERYYGGRIEYPEPMLI